MYESFFQLKQKPFDLTPNPQFLFMSQTHRKALNYLEYGLQDRSGFMLLTGEVGSGKTTLIRLCVRQLDKTVTVARIFNTKVNADQLMAMINKDFGLDSRGKDKASLVGELYDFLISEYERGRRAILIIDEAQNLSFEMLEEVRLLSNLETDQSKLLQIILVGQPELANKISLPIMRQLRQRIGFICRLQSLNREETEEYILHRMDVAGNRNALHFAPKAMDVIHAYSGGIPRQINTIGNLLFLTAFTEERRDIDEAMVKDICEHISDAADDEAPLTLPPDLSGKRALLAALGIPANPSPQSIPAATDVAPLGGVHVTVRDLRRRLKALEQKFISLTMPKSGDR